MSAKRDGHKGRSYTPPSRDELLAMKEQKQRTMPNGEAGRRELTLLRHYSAAQEDLQWIVDNNAWTELGFDTFTGWFGERVAPVVRAAGLRPTQEFALYVLENVRADESALPRQQRLLQKELAGLVGVSVSTLRRLSQDRPQASNDAGADLDESAEPSAEPHLEPTDDVTAALAQAIADTAASVGAGIAFSEPQRPAGLCPVPPDPFRCGGCGTDISWPNRSAGQLRCQACDPSSLHRAEPLGFDEGWGECNECRRLARLASETAGGDTAPVGAGDAEPSAVGSEPVESGLGPGNPAHMQLSGWGGAAGGCGVSCACGVMFDGFDTIAEAAELLERHIANPEDLGEEDQDEDEPLLNQPCEKDDCDALVGEDEAKAGFLRCEDCDPDGEHASSIDLDGACRTCAKPLPRRVLVHHPGGGSEPAELQAYNDDGRTAKVVYEESHTGVWVLVSRIEEIEDSPAADGSLPDGASPAPGQPGANAPTGRDTSSPGADVPEAAAVATTDRSETDHHQVAGVSSGGVEAPARDGVVEPVGLGDGGFTDAGLPFSSDPWLPDMWSGGNGDDVLWLFTRIEEVLDRVLPDVVGPVLVEAEIKTLRDAAGRVSEVVGLIEHWRAR